MFPEGRLLEFIIVGAVALVVVGPKDLPILMRKVGQFIGRMRAMAAEFRASFDELARQSELDELRREVEALRNANPVQGAADAAGVGEMKGTFDEIDASLRDGTMQLHPPMAYQHQPPEAEPAAPPAAEPPAKPKRASRAKPAAGGAAKPKARKSARKPKSQEIVR
jgi:sec-independent protein translocase protein TatB